MSILVPTHNAQICQFTVQGLPKTKGSLRPVGRIGQRVRLVEQVDPQKIWRTTVAIMARQACKKCGIGQPIDYPIAVQMIFKMKKPQRPKFAYPATRGGDIDKLQRNVFDALQDAQLITDDALAVSVQVDKIYAPTDAETGVTIALWRAG